MSIYVERRHRSRKKRSCLGCYWKSDTNPIEAGQFYWACFVADGSRRGGGSYAYSLCEACHEFLASEKGYEFLDECEDGEWTPGALLHARTHT